MMVEVKPETNAGICEIQPLNVLAFGQEHETKVVDALRNSEIFIPQLSLLELNGKNIVGHILLSNEK